MRLHCIRNWSGDNPGPAGHQRLPPAGKAHPPGCGARVWAGALCLGRSPPGATDCWLLAFGQVKGAIVVTDDLGMHTLAEDFGLKVWHGFELLAKLRTAKVVSNDLVREIYDALERNGDMTETWRRAKHSEFARIFGE